MCPIQTAANHGKRQVAPAHKPLTISCAVLLGMTDYFLARQGKGIVLAHGAAA